MSAFSFGSSVNPIGDPLTNGSSFGSWGTGMAATVSAPAPVATSPGGSMPSATVAAPTAGPQTPAAQGGGMGNLWGENGAINTVLGGVQVLGNLWNSFQQHKMAKDQMKFAREQWDTNLQNQTQTYNTALEDRIRSRHFTEGRGGGETDQYLKKHSL